MTHDLRQIVADLRADVFAHLARLGRPARRVAHAGRLDRLHVAVEERGVRHARMTRFAAGKEIAVLEVVEPVAHEPGAKRHDGKGEQHDGRCGRESAADHGAVSDRRRMAGGSGARSGSFAIQLAKRQGAHVTAVDNAGKLDHIDQTYGGVEAYLASELGIGPAEIARLRELYLV